METVTAIIEKRGGWNALIENYIRIENPPFVPLVIEFIGEGPNHLSAISIAHYGELNGDLMRDPEMCFEIALNNKKPPRFFPYYYRNDYLGKEYWTYAMDDQGRFIPGSLNEIEQRGMIELMDVWDENIKYQGFLELA